MGRRFEVKESIFTHRFLWKSSSALAKLLEADEAANQHLIIPALVATAMAFEAFVNCCGIFLLPEQWANEREEFRGQGIEGKLAAIAGRVPQFEIRKGEEPYQSIRKLIDFRDAIAHGKVQRYRYEMGSLDNWRDLTTWELPNGGKVSLSREGLEKARSNVLSYCDGLWVAMRDLHDVSNGLRLELLHSAFDGPLVWSEATGVG
jgi:hypothetical protein